MGKLKIRIKNERSALLDVEDSGDDFGIFRISQERFKLGFRENPMFEITHSLVNERWEIDLLPGARRIEKRDLVLNDHEEKWLKKSCCNDFSILSFLPNGRYRLIKTSRQLQFSKEILMGNEWTVQEKNVRCFEGSNEDGLVPAGGGKKTAGKHKYYSMIIGNKRDCVPLISQPLLGVVLLNYGIVWEGATGFIFFSFAENDPPPPAGTEIILVIPADNSFILDCLGSGPESKSPGVKEIADFINII